MAAHERHGTWVLIDGDETDSDEIGKQSVAVAPVVRPHIVHMNGRSYLPPDIKQKVEARFRMMQQQHQLGERQDERERLRETLRVELGLN